MKNHPLEPGNGIARQGDLAAANAKLQKAVKDSLDQDEELKKADLQVTADVTKNEVTLVGTVGSRAVHDKALELTKTAHVGVIIEDKTSVRPRGR